jgi:Flp pilus assembly protein TadG
MQNTRAHLSLLAALREFRHDAVGASATFVALCLPVLIGMAGLVLDYSRAQTMQSRIQYAVDVSALASAAAVRNGADATTAQNVAQSVLKWNLDLLGANFGTPQVQVSTMGTQFTSQVSVQGSLNTTVGKLLGVSNVNSSGTATAQALAGPSGTAALALNANGGGLIYGDPHLVYTPAGGTTTDVSYSCDGGSWYNMLSDGGLQWNSVCLNDGSSLYMSGSQIKIGTHTITYIPYQGPGFQGWQNYVDSFADDCISISTPAYGACGQSYAATLVVDGQIIDPTLPQYAGQNVIAILNDTVQNIVVTVQMSSHALPSWFASPPAGVFNYQAVDIASANYELTFSFPAGYQNSWVKLSNAGLCGSPGGYFGSFIAGSPATSPVSYVVPDPSYQGGQFTWTSTCNYNGGQIAHLVQ